MTGTVPAKIVESTHDITSRAIKSFEKPIAIPNTPESPAAKTRTFFRCHRPASQAQNGRQTAPVSLFAATSTPKSAPTRPRALLMVGNKVPIQTRLGRFRSQTTGSAEPVFAAVQMKLLPCASDQKMVSKTAEMLVVLIVGRQSSQTRCLELTLNHCTSRRITELARHLSIVRARIVACKLSICRKGLDQAHDHHLTEVRLHALGGER